MNESTTRAAPGWLVLWCGLIVHELVRGSLRPRTEMGLHLWASRRPPGKVRGMRIASYSIDEQRRRAGCIGVQKCDVISTRGLTMAGQE